MSVEQVFDAPWTLRQLRAAPLGPHLQGYCDWMRERGFRRDTMRHHLGCLIHFNQHLGESAKRWSPCITEREVEGFFTTYPSRARHRGPLEQHLRRLRYSVNRFVEYLSDHGHFQRRSQLPIYASLQDRYLAWMRDHQHAAPTTLELRRQYLRRFLDWLGPEASSEGMSRLTGPRIEQFFLDYAPSLGRAARRSLQAALRTFLRFCWHQGHIRQRLDQAVPTLRTYKLATVPRGLSETEAQAILRSVDRHTAAGRRDYAILQLLYTYGVRGGQVHALRLDEIDWSKDQILFRATKNGKDCRMPLTVAVGESLLDYLQHARPDCSFPEIFLSCRAPYHPLRRSNASEIVHRHIATAGLELPCRGAHIFRHAFATRLVAAGYPFKAVADALGHRHLSTTFRYTKVDFDALQQVALPWPEEVRS